MCLFESLGVPLVALFFFFGFWFLWFIVVFGEVVNRKEGEGGQGASNDRTRRVIYNLSQLNSHRDVINGLIKYGFKV